MNKFLDRITLTDSFASANFSQNGRFTAIGTLQAKLDDTLSFEIHFESEESLNEPFDAKPMFFANSYSVYESLAIYDFATLEEMEEAFIAHFDKEQQEIRALVRKRAEERQKAN